MSDLVPSYGERFITAPGATPKFTGQTGRHHRPFYDDYAAAKLHIFQAVGDVSSIEIWGRQVLCAVYVAPRITPMGIINGPKETKEHWWQSKTVLILKKGPEAFVGAESYHNATFGKGVSAPEVGDWLFANASAGIQISLCCDGASRPQGRLLTGEMIDLFDESEGWPCRIIGDDNFLGRLTKPHSVV